MTDDNVGANLPRTGSTGNTPRGGNPGPRKPGGNTTNTPGGGQSTNKPSRSNSGTGKKNGANGSPAGATASLADSIHPPSSTDNAQKFNQNRSQSPQKGNINTGRGRPSPRGGNGSHQNPSMRRPSQTGVPAPASNDAISSVQRVINEMRSIPTAAPNAARGANDNNHPGHRKSGSLGSSQGGFPSSLSGFNNQLHPMPEDAEDGVSYAESEEYNDQPGFAQPGQYRVQQQQQQHQNAFMPPTLPGHDAMAQYEALQRAQLQAQQQQQIGMQGEAIGPSGRPALAPNFQFGARRRHMSEDQTAGGFNGGQPGQGQGNVQHGLHASMHAGNNEMTMLAEQVALQQQIEALQQQQQALLQHQLAQSQVLSNAFTAPDMSSHLRHGSMANMSLMGGMGAAGPANQHRRVQSTQVPMPGSFGSFSIPNTNLAMQNLMGMGNMDPGLLNHARQGSMAQGPGGHGRRHSVNVGLRNNNQSVDFGNDGFDDGFSQPQQFGGHSRQGSTWRQGAGGAPAPATDLASATAQLNSLQQFRAASGGHHQKMASFSFPNMLPNMVAANMMGFGGFNMNLLQQQQQQIQQFQLQLQQSQTPQRKSLFAPYLPQASLPPLLAAGKLVVGILRVNKRNRSDAYISTEVLDSDIYICGSKDRNRALEGDIVAVELLDVDDVWGTKKEKEEKKRKKEEGFSSDKFSRKTEKKKDDVEVEGQGLMLFEDEEVTDEIKPQYAGHVVAVVERMPGQLFSGTLGLLRPSSAATKEKQEAERREREGDRAEEERPKQIERPKIVWFKPTDKRVPLIAIPTEQAPPDFVQNSDAYADKLFVACIKRHPISSLHPFGTLVEELGPIGDVEVETSALLKDCNFPTEEFTENVKKNVPPVPYVIPSEEIASRRDLREELVFTIDPESAKDLDDALSVKQTEGGTLEIGVHIADVSHFVKQLGPVDRDARKRATSVYLVQRSVPMLPPALCEEVCSLNAGEDRLAFSVFFTMSEDGQILKKDFARTIVRSAAKLSYEQAQTVIDGKSLPDSAVQGQSLVPQVAEAIKTLHKLAQILRQQRKDNGMLSSSDRKLSFALDGEGRPTDCFVKTRASANELIEEFMLQANIAVAHQIAVHLPEQALLRRHEDPTERRLIGFQKRAAGLGVDIDITSAASIQNSIDAIGDPFLRGVIELLSSKTMQHASYYCAGMLDISRYNHFALNIPLYTHFTSPIRRYADVIVHRQLESSLASSNAEPKFTMDRDTIAKIAQQSNIKKQSAKLAQEQSAHLFLCLLLSDLTQKYGPVVRQARVVGVLDSAFDVLLPEFGIEKRVHVDQMPVNNHVFEEKARSLTLYWSDKDVIAWLAEANDDDHLRKVKQTAEQHAAKMEISSRSVHDESALFDDDDDEDEVVLHGAFNKTAATEGSKQQQLSAAKIAPVFDGLKTVSGGHQVQEIREMQSVPVIVTADLTKSPPVIKVLSVNPYAVKKA